MNILKKLNFPKKFYVLVDSKTKKILSTLLVNLKDLILKIDIVGIGSKKNNLQNLSIEKGVKNFLNSLNNNDLIKLYSNYKYFISSSFYEGHPKTVLEICTQDVLFIYQIFKTIQN